MDIKSTYHTYLVNKDKDKTREPNKFHASSAGVCYLKQMYSIFDFEESKIDDRLHRIFRIGNMIHEDIQKSLILSKDEINGDLYIEEPIEIPMYNLVGTYDVGQKDNDIFNLYDIKTTAAWTWTKMFGHARNRIRGTGDNYKMQIATYGIGIQEQHDLSQLNMYLLYYKKDSSHWKEIPISDEWIEKAHLYWQELNEIYENYGKAFEEELRPDWHFGVPFNKQECSYCNFYHISPSKLAPKRNKKNEE